MSRAVDEHLFKRQGANKNSAEEKGFCPKKIIVARWPQWPAVEYTLCTMYIHIMFFSYLYLD